MLVRSPARPRARPRRRRRAALRRRLRRQRARLREGAGRLARRRWRASTTRQTSCSPGGTDAFEQPPGRAQGVSGRRQHLGLLVRTLPVRVPALPAASRAKLGKQVAFLGVNSDDSEDAAQTFLDEYPVPYPSYSDPDQEICARPRRRRSGFPATAFYDRNGELVYLKQGAYAERGGLPRRHRALRAGSRLTAARRDNSAHERSLGLSRGRLRSRCSPAPALALASLPAGRGQAGGRVRLLARAERRDLARDRGLGRPRARGGRRREREVAIIRLDTPGGLDTSLRDIVKDILAAPMPVIVYVEPERRPGRPRPASTSPRPPTSRRWRRRPTSARRRRSRSGPAPTTRCWGARSATTPPPTCGRWRRPTGATPSSARRW